MWWNSPAAELMQSTNTVLLQRQEPLSSDVGDQNEATAGRGSIPKLEVVETFRRVSEAISQNAFQEALSGVCGVLLAPILGAQAGRA
jgi:hypothetical protein